MKTNLIVLFTTIIFTSSCSPLLKLPIGGSNAFKTAPLPPPSLKSPRFIFPGEAFPDTNYIKMTVLEVRTSYLTTYNNLLQILELEGKNAGMDAVIIMDRNENTNYRTTGGKYVSSIRYDSEVLSGLGVRYRNNMQYVTNFIKTINLSYPSTNSYKSDSLKMDFDRNVIEYKNDLESIKLYDQYIKPYTPFEFFESSKNWFVTRDAKKRIKTKYHYLPEDWDKKFKFFYDHDNNVRLAKINRQTPSRIYSEMASFIYNDKKQVIRIDISKSKEKYQILNEYDKEGRIISTKVLNMKDGKLIVEADFNYYLPSDFQFVK